MRTPTDLQSALSGLLILLALAMAVVAWPFWPGSYIAVEVFDAGNPSVARTVCGWIFEAPYVVGVIISSVLASDKRTKRREEKAQRLRQLAESGIVYELQPGVYRHGACTINHRTTDTAGRCKAKTAGADTNRTHYASSLGALAPTQKRPPDQVPRQRRETSFLRFGATTPTSKAVAFSAAGLLVVIAIVVVVSVAVTHDERTSAASDQRSPVASPRQYAQTNLPFSGIDGPWDVAVDSNVTV